MGTAFAPIYWSSCLLSCVAAEANFERHPCCLLPNSNNTSSTSAATTMTATTNNLHPISVRNAVAEPKPQRQANGPSRGIARRKPSNPNLGYSTRLACLKNALDDLDQQLMQPDFHAFAHLFRECANLRALVEGKRVHAHFLKSQFARNRFLGHALLNMYAKCGCIEEARGVFNNMPKRDVATWTAIIAAYIQLGQSKEALDMFKQMTNEGVKPDKVTLTTMLGCFSSAAGLKEGKLMHALILKEGFESDLIVGTALIRMYSKCGSIKEARRAFENMIARDVVAWTTMISSYVKHGHYRDAFKVFRAMQQQGMKPNKVTLLSMLGACGGPSFLAEGSCLHQQIVECGYDQDLVVCNALVTMYGNCGKLENAREVFDKMRVRDVVSWNAMIAAYSQHGNSKLAFEILEKMKGEGVKPNAITIINILEAYSSPDDLADGRLVHAYAINSGLELDVVVGNALINMYGKCGSPNDARSVFDRMPVRDVISWTAMIAAYAEDGKLALFIFDLMQKQGVKPNRITFVCLLDACARMEFATAGRMIHTHILASGLESDIDVGTALVTMYGRCGCLEDAKDMFVGLQQRDLLSWNSMMAAYAQHGQGEEAVLLLGQMQLDGFKPDEVTLISLLSSCSHTGLVEEGSHYYNSVDMNQGIKPLIEHYGCIVDLLGRAGQLDKAKEFLSSLPVQPGVVPWMTLLGACRVHGDVERGKCAADNVLELDPQNAACYAILASIYAAAGRWDDVARTRKGMLDMGVEKEPW
ncbi:hypothetical protein O6H91_17G077500 [Diphasiastrum complanatum]|uniref:Uncharacterized protein n=1 Tax=Diphasiastrum complanatum TaxID=34168 RepID=A0ACC2B8E1_DIPCM|nr:hypothetical protein O6H91_17G077500 [Diphasiastrum complanatum]